MFHYSLVAFQCQTHLTWIELEHFGVGGLWAIPWYSVLVKSCGPKCLDTLTKSSCTTQACQGDTSSKSWAFGLVSSDTKWQHMTHSSRETLHFLYLWEVWTGHSGGSNWASPRCRLLSSDSHYHSFILFLHVKTSFLEFVCHSFHPSIQQSNDVVPIWCHHRKRYRISSDRRGYKSRTG